MIELLILGLFGIIGGLALAFAGAAIAQRKGRSFWGFLLLGLFAPIISIAVALIISPIHLSAATRECPHCFSQIDRRATICGHCQKELPVAPSAEAKAAIAKTVLATHLMDRGKCLNCGAKEKWIVANRYKCKKG